MVSFTEKNEGANLRKKSSLVLDVSMMGAVLLVTILFSFSSSPQGEAAKKEVEQEEVELIKTPPSEQLNQTPPPARPQIPIEAEDDDEDIELTIDDTEVDIRETVLEVEAPEEEEEAMEFYAVSEKPRILKRGVVRYPEIARKAGVEAKVVIEFTISKDGKPIGFKIIKGHPMLNDAAIATAKQYKFSPAKQGDKAVKVKWQIPFRFRLHQ
jgi:protein TonB